MSGDEDQPTIEQKSHFSAKTKGGEDVEFKTVLRFYVSPTGEVNISAPGADGLVAQPEKSVKYGHGPVDDQEKPVQHDQGPVDYQEKSVKYGTVPVVKPEHKESNKPETKPEEPKTPKPRRRDESVGKRSSGCPITQFIPDPCTAIDDLRKFVRGIFCDSPPPPSQKYLSSNRKMSKSDIKKENTDKVSEGENEIMGDEEKYDV